jgi:hypothetical protein
MFTNLHLIIIKITMIIYSSVLFAQVPDTVWAKKYGGMNSDVGFSVIQTSFDNSYIITGYTTSYGGGDRDVYIIKTDVW